MNEIKVIEGGVTAAKGFKAAGAYAGIGKNAEKGDLALVYSEVPGNAAAVYTKNKVKAAHIAVTKDHLQDGVAQAIICNSGNANTCTPNGVEIAQKETELVAEALGIKAADVLPAATGVIGVPLEIAPFENTIPELAEKLSPEGSAQAADAIRTTDTYIKECAVTFELNGTTCTIGGIAKGSGMIHVNMGTMLSFIGTDVKISKELVQKALSDEILDSYNQVSVDGDTSTNDTLIIMASGLAGNPEITEENADYDAFVAALTAIAEHMCAEHAGDGEGATHLITCEVTHAPDLKTARAVSRSVVCSNLFKAAVFGRDANWGRILCAIGYTPGDFSIDKVCVWLSSKAGEVYVCENAAYHPYSEEEAAKVLAEHDVLVKVDMGTGDASAKAWGCDLTYDYVKINGDYRT